MHAEFRTARYSLLLQAGSDLACTLLTRYFVEHPAICGCALLRQTGLISLCCPLQTAAVADRAILQILNLRLIYVLLGIAALYFFHTDQLQNTALGRAALIGMALFWVGRTVEQFVFLRINRPMVHALTALFVLGAAIFSAPLCY
ncbi:hypothetical protein K4L06_00920 [Lysobacter sp. BMK333-48F3]|uniref:hypothetical protein n=1 Tax=Lysobacter sp. BMK333-48F3 TaxID=2867962 RepID=UPI001C8CB0F9|nr:hypothetical protein [Lysobacter sp. BMK333-48F3]MBX9399855.1 hypothetical protein [Lysobacter sp. BMK333-48F3]